MLDTSRNELESTLTPLLAGILEDSQSLLRQEFALAKSEAHREFRKLGQAAVSLGLGVVTGFVSAVLIALTAVYSLSALFPELELWHCFGLIGLGLALTSVLLLMRAKQTLGSVDISLPETRESLKEITHV